MIFKLKVSVVRDDYSGEKDMTLVVSVYKWSDTKPVHNFQTKIKTHSFSAKVVYTKSIPELLKEAKCVDRTECVLAFELADSTGGRYVSILINLYICMFIFFDYFSKGGEFHVIIRTEKLEIS